MKEDRPEPDPAAVPSRTRNTRETVLDVALALHRAGTWEKTAMLEIAAASRVTRQTLYNLFSHRDGITQALLAREIGRLLATTDTAIGRIARASGFTSVERMAKVFRRVDGLTPSEYRRSVRTIRVPLEAPAA